MVIGPASHADDPGLIPGLGDLFLAGRMREPVMNNTPEQVSDFDIASS